MAGMSNAQAALIAAATQASRGNAMGIEPMLVRAGKFKAWLDAQDAEAATPWGECDGGCACKASKHHEGCFATDPDVVAAQRASQRAASTPITVCGHQHVSKAVGGYTTTCALASGHAGVHRVTHGDTRYEWSDHSALHVQHAVKYSEGGAWAEKSWNDPLEVGNGTR